MTTESKHSPRPWFWDDKAALPWTDYDETIHAPFLMDANGSIVMSGDDIRIRNEADGQLMIAAPDLLAALKATLVELKEFQRIFGICVSHGERMGGWLEEVEEMIAKIEPAIAKAEGKS